MPVIRDIPPMDWPAFKRIPDGTIVLNHGVAQCVAVANQYHVGTLRLPLPGGFHSAYQWWTEFKKQPNLYNNYRKRKTPIAGALYVARGGAFNSRDGHIGVVTSVNSDGTFNTIEQNGEAERFVHHYRRSRNMPGIYGFLEPKNNPAKSNDQNLTKGSVTMGSYTASQSVPGGSVWKTMQINKDGDISVKLGPFNGLAVGSFWVKGAPGTQVQVALSEDLYRDKKTLKSARLRTVSGVIPARGILKLQVSAGVVLEGKENRLRLKASNDSSKPVEVSYVAWDLIGGK